MHHGDFIQCGVIIWKITSKQARGIYTEVVKHMTPRSQIHPQTELPIRKDDSRSCTLFLFRYYFIVLQSRLMIREIEFYL